MQPDPALGLLQLYDDALPHVYGYLLARCGDTSLAEDLTAESFLAAVHAVRKPGAPGPSVPWLIGVARHKLADHWRARPGNSAGCACWTASQPRADDPWEAAVDRIRAREVLGRLGPHHRAALTLRYLDGLPVPEVALLLDRTVHATEALLGRARPRSAGCTSPMTRGGPAMTDPFEGLREPGTPADPDPYFAVAMRLRLTRESSPPQEEPCLRPHVGARPRRRPR